MIAVAWCAVAVSVSTAFAKAGPQCGLPPAEEPAEEPAKEPAEQLSKPKFCEFTETEGFSRLDLVHLKVYQSVCSTAAWFDGFFGDLRADDDDPDGARGRIGLAVSWDEAENSADLDSTFRVHFPLPRAERKLRAFLGKVESEQYIEDVSGGFETIPLAFRELEDEEWLVGLGYARPSRDRTDLDLSVGVNFRTPIEPYVKARYRVQFRLGENSLGRFRETIFWRKRKGYGATSRLDLERLIGDRFLIRWVNAGTLSEADLGVSWYSQATLYNNVGEGKALALQAGISGETDAKAPVRDVAVRAIYRQSIKRQWLFGELRVGVHWPRKNVNVEREAALEVGVGLEMRFDRSFLELGKAK